ncbi:MAG: hypothetical protein ACRCYY_00615 [Trueperaceae bacterium]
MRNVFFILLTTLILAVTACDTSKPKPTNTCTTTDCTNNSTDPDAETPDDTTNTDGNNGGNGGGDTGGGNNGGNTGSEQPTKPAFFNHSLLSGMVSDYEGNKALTIKALWVDQSSGDTVELSTGDYRLETNGSFSLKLDMPGETAFASLPLLECGDITSTTKPADLTEVPGVFVPTLFVYDGEEAVGFLLHGSYSHDADGNIVPRAKLAMRVYSAADKIVSQGTCAGEEAAGLVTELTSIGFGNALEGIPGMEMAAPPSVSVRLDVGLEKGWNTVVLGANDTEETLEFTLIDNSNPNYTWYYLPLAALN